MVENEEATEKQPMKILAIDDNPDNLTALGAVIAERLPGVQFLTALSGHAGLEVASSEDPDVILLDIVMPGMDGYEVCRKLKADESLRGIPVLFLTALRSDIDNRRKALEAGAEGFLAKPLDELELNSQIQAMAKIKAASLAHRNDRARLADLVEQRTCALQQSQNSMLNLLEDLRAEIETRKQTELALQKSLSILNETGSLAKVGGWELNVDTGIATWTQGTYRIFEIDVTHDEPSLAEGLSCYLPASRPIIAQAVQRAIEFGEPYDLELELITAKGNHRWVHTNGRANHVNGKIQSVSGIIQDITEHKQAGLAQAKQLAELQRWHAATLGREGRIAELKLEVNSLASRLGQPLPYATPEELEHQISLSSPLV